MRTGLESLRLSPNPSPSRPENTHHQTISTDIPPLTINITRTQLKLEMSASPINSEQSEESIGTATAEQIVVNSRNLRLLRLSGTDEIRYVMLISLIDFAARNGLNLLPSEQIDEETKQWLADNQLSANFTNPNI
jgi:hypothetical protein